MAKPRMPETIPWSLAWIAVLLLTVKVSALHERQLLQEVAQGGSRWKADGQDTASGQNSTKPGRFRSGQYLGFQRAQHGVPGYGVRRHVILGSTSLPAGEFYEVNVARPRKGAPPALNMSELVPEGFGGYSSCFMRAQRFPEPMSPLYERRHAPPTSLPGGVNRAFYRWPGNVTRADFDAVPYSQRGPLCGHCTNFVSYQIINGSLYRGHEKDAYPDMAPHRQRAEDMLLVVLYLWDLPDMDFKLHFGDGCPTDVAAFTWNVCRHKPKGGFTMPSTTAWVAALGPVQTQVYYACLAHRYPINERRPVAFWRGTNTDNTLVDRFTAEDYRNCTRIRLHMDFKPTNKTRIDAQIYSLIFADPVVKQAVGTLSPRVPMEDFNKAAIVLDMDGNGWSDRWVKIIPFNTFMLKQASNNTAFFEHLHTGPVGFFKNDLSDLQAVVDRALEVWDNNPQILQARTASRQGFAAAMLNQVAVAEAMGHALMVYHSKVTWQAVADPTYKLVPFRNVCNIGMTCLPQQLCDNIRQHKAAEQEGRGGW